MENQIDNQDQIIRKDARGCFVEVKNDCFHLDKIHLQFVTYDKSRPAGQRYTNNVHIYIDVPEFLELAQEAASGSLHMRMQQFKAEHKSDALYEHLGGTSAKKLAFFGKSRPDGMSVSRVVKLTAAEKADYFFTADSGPGEENKTGLIVPRFGKSPEQHVSVILTWRQLNELLFTTVAHYKAWLSAKYAAEWAAIHGPRCKDQAKPPRQDAPPAAAPSNARQSTQKPPPAPAPAPPQAPQQPAFGSAFGSVYGSTDGRPRADDTKFF